MSQEITLWVNENECRVQVEPDELLVDVLREKIGLTGTKKGCGTGDCGACTVILEGRAVTSCMVLAVGCDGKNIETVEGLEKNGELHPLQRFFIEKGAIQCGFCTPGTLMTAKAILDHNPNPSEADVRAGIAGNLCRCTGYTKIVEAILAAAAWMNNGGVK